MCIYVYFYVNRFGDKDVVCGFEIEVLDHNLNKFHVNLYKHYVILFKNILNNKGLEYFRTESNVILILGILTIAISPNPI